MQNTVHSSELFGQRIREVVPRRLEEMQRAILSQDFDTFARLTMQDSNSFHAVCLDTFPPIFYLNDTSRAVIALVNIWNEWKASLAEEGPGKRQFRLAYTFDAGPNAVIYGLAEDIAEFKSFLAPMLMGADGSDSSVTFPELLKARVQALLPMLNVEQALES